MFKDYYCILEILHSATQAEIKSAYKKQALKWHPDKNIGTDTNTKMKEINEAYLILKDSEARRRYDIEYLKYKEFKEQNQHQRAEKKNEKQENTNSKTKSKSRTYEYEVEDETLEKWMQNARRQAVDLAKQTLKEIADLSVEATKQAGSKMFQMLIYYAISGLIIMLLFKACN